MRNWFKGALVAAGVAAVLAGDHPSRPDRPGARRTRSGACGPAARGARSGAGRASAAHGRRQAEPERDLAGDGELQLEPRGPRRPGRAVLPARRHRRDSGGPGHRRRRRDSVHARRAGQEKRERAQPADARSGSEVLHAGHPARHLHAVSVSDRSEPAEHPVRLRIRIGQPRREHGQADRGSRGQLDGLVERQVGRRHAGRRSHRSQRQRVARPRRQLHHRHREKSSSAIRCIDADHINYEATIEDAKTFTRPWKISTVLYKHMEKNFQLLEFKCVEFSEELLYGHLRKRDQPPGGIASGGT